MFPADDFQWLSIRTVMQGWIKEENLLKNTSNPDLCLLPKSDAGRRCKITLDSHRKKFKFDMRSMLLMALAMMLLSGISSCGPKSNTVRDAARDSLHPNTAVQGQPTNVASSSFTQGAAVFHYICPNNCPGSGGDAAGKCPVCGTDYIHNQEYHNQAQNAQNTANNSGEKVIKKATFSGNSNGEITSTTTTVEPAQNAAGVWHYVCEKGCEGGAGAPGICPNCGAKLVHNAAYHEGEQ